MSPTLWSAPAPCASSSICRSERSSDARTRDMRTPATDSIALASDRGSATRGAKRSSRCAILRSLLKSTFESSAAKL
eukprot:scaffold48_cov311-Pinguiococcus_pyrenoidosus.AAC.170